jgi:hypothetical protein
VAKQFWHPGYWVDRAVDKARGKKNSPWVLVLLVVAVLWIWGHLGGTPVTPGPAAHPSPSASSSASPGRGAASAGKADR